MQREMCPEASDGRHGEQQVSESSWMDDEDRAGHRRQEEDLRLAPSWIERAASRSDGVFTL